MAKICIVCGEDCSTRPRVKNPKGEYVCKACLESKKGNASKGPAPVASGAFGVQALPDELLQDLPDPSAEDACSSCGRKLPEGAVICTSCGVNQRTGKVLKTKTVAVKEPSALGGAAVAAGTTVALPVLWTIGGLVGGAVGAAVWAAVAYYANVEIGWLAIGVGFVTGLGVAVASGGNTSAASGGVAVLIACAAILGGRYAAFHFAVKDFASEIAGIDFSQPITENEMLAEIADEIAYNKELEGEILNWPRGMSWDEAFELDDYPGIVVRVARAEWNKLSAGEKSSRLANRSFSDSEFIREIADRIGGEREANGEDLNWPRDESVDTALFEIDYPAGLWAQATGEWESLGTSGQGSERRRMQDQWQREFRANSDEFIRAVTEEGFAQSFDYIDILFFALAIGAAFQVGSSGSYGSDD